jgi:ribosomal protein S18 acetylase RimI-like enzyme
MMVHLEEQASQQGYQILRLETGANQPEAVNLYRKLGYHNIPKFGEYINDPYSVCMEKKIGFSI